MDAEFVLDAQNTIGRHPKNSIRLHDREVSKNHATITRTGTEYQLKISIPPMELSFNSRRVSETILKDGDELLFGSMKLTFKAALQSVKSATTSAKDLVQFCRRNLRVQPHPYGHQAR